MPRTKPVSVKVIAYAPTAFTHCQHCEVTFQQVGVGERLRRQEAAESLPSDLIGEFQQVSDWIRRLVARHGGRIHVKVVDATSIEGFVASLRHRVRRYPAVIVDGTAQAIGAQLAAAEPAIDEAVRRRLAEVAASASV